MPKAPENLGDPGWPWEEDKEDIDVKTPPSNKRDDSLTPESPFGVTRRSSPMKDAMAGMQQKKPRTTLEGLEVALTPEEKRKIKAVAQGKKTPIQAQKEVYDKHAAALDQQAEIISRTSIPKRKKTLQEVFVSQSPTSRIKRSATRAEIREESSLGALQRRAVEKATGVPLPPLLEDSPKALLRESLPASVQAPRLPVPKESFQVQPDPKIQYTVAKESPKGLLGRAWDRFKSWW